MKALVLGFKRMSGTSKPEKGGRPFDFCQLFIGTPINVEAGKVNVIGAGYEQAALDIELGCEGQFAGLKFPAQVELKVDHRMNRFQRMDVVVTGLLQPVQGVKTA